MERSGTLGTVVEKQPSPNGAALPAACRSESLDDTLVVDRVSDGQPIGIEIIDPAAVSLDRINTVLRQLQQPELSASDLEPLYAA